MIMLNETNNFSMIKATFVRKFIFNASNFGIEYRDSHYDQIIYTN